MFCIMICLVYSYGRNLVLGGYLVGIDTSLSNYDVRWISVLEGKLELMLKYKFFHTWMIASSAECNSFAQKHMNDLNQMKY